MRPSQPDATNGQWTIAVPVGDLTEGQPVRLFLGERMVLVVRQGQHIFACDALCPHKYGSLPDGELGDACITCPIHDATFDLRTGEPGDGEAWAGRLAVYETRIQDGMVLVMLP